MADFGSRLRELRVRRGLRQKDLASELGLAQTTIANYEQRLRFPDEPTLLRIADFFSVSLDHLMGRENGGGPAERAPAGTSDIREEEGTLPPRALEYLQAARGGGTEAARANLHALLAAGTSIQEVYLHVLAPALKEVGRLWSLGELSVGEEHSFSEATMHLMASLAPAAPPKADSAGARVRCLVLAVSGETHVIGARMVADFLSMAGFDVRFLGGNLSIGTVLELLRSHPRALVALSVTLPEHLGAAQDLIRSIRADRNLDGAKVLAGGQAFDGSMRGGARIGADASGVDAEEAARAAAALAEKLR